MARHALERPGEGEAAPIDSEIAEASPVSAAPFLLEDFAGLATYRGKPIYNHEQVIGQIDAGVEFNGNTITFTFLDGPHSIGIHNNPRYALLHDRHRGVDGSGRRLLPLARGASLAPPPGGARECFALTPSRAPNSAPH